MDSNTASLIKGTVVSDYTMDPKQLKRIQVYIPAIHGEFKNEMVGTTDNNNEPKYPWAQCSVSGGLENVPKSGSTVWIIFETDNPEFPVVIGSHTAALTENSSSEGTGVAGGSLAQIAAQIIFGNEGGYSSVNWNDNGAISIGKIQWHANNARNLLKEIREKNSGNFDSICNGCTLVSDLSKDWGSWRNWSAFCPCGIALVKVLKTNESKEVQDSKAVEYVQGYIDNIQKKGVTDAKCIIYLADIANQGPKYAYDIAAAAAAAGCNTLDALHSAVRSGKFGVYGWINDSRGMTRRNRTYQAIIKAEQEGKFTENNLTNMAGRNKW